MASVRSLLIIGYGEMGHAMEALLGPRHRLLFHDARPMAGHENTVLDAAAGVDGVIYCVPVTPLAGLAQQVLPHLAANSISLSVAKGLDEAGRPAARILADVYGSKRDYGVLYGPMIAEEICKGLPAFAEAGVSQAGCFDDIAQWYAGSHLELEYCDDMAGISWASVLKNVYAMLFGMADGLQLGDNARGFLAVAALREMQAIVTAMGGRPETVLSLAGLGDLVTTATSVSSHHHELGRRLALGEQVNGAAEGTHTLSMVRKYRLLAAQDYPLFALVQAFIDDPADLRRRLLAYMHMPA